MLTCLDRIAPAQLLGLKAVVNYLTPDRVLGTMLWIEDHEIERVASSLEASNLRAHQQWCGSCTKVFFVRVSSFSVEGL